MASRRILSNANLAPIQELAVNPYNSFNSDYINKLTRIVSGGKDKDVVVNGLDVNSFTDKKWYASHDLLPSLNEDNKWSGENYYLLNKTQDGEYSTKPVIHFELPHQKSYGFSYVSCKIDDSWVNHLYKSSYCKEYEVTFTLDFGTPKAIVAKINDCEVSINHPKSGCSYSLPLTKYFKDDTLSKGLTFTLGAVLDGADPECKFEYVNNKTYIVVSNFGLRMKGYEFPEFANSPGKIENNYSIYGIHPTHNIDITPGVAIKDDVMLEELAPSIDKFKKFRLDLTKSTSWIKNNPFTMDDFSKHGKQVAYQCNDNGDVYKERQCQFDDNGIKIQILDHDDQPKWVRPTDDVVLTYDLDGNNLDRQFSFDRYTNDDEFQNFTLHSDGSVLDSVKSYSNTVIVCFVDDDGKYRVIGYKINVVKGGEGVTAPEISPVTPDVKEVDADDQAANIIFDNGKSFDIPILAYKLPKKISDYGADWRNRIKGFLSIGPTKVSGDAGCYNSDAVQWGYVVLYYAYFKNPKPNTSYIGLIRESDLEQNRDDYLVLAKVRFIDPHTVDIISYENRQRKQIPTGQEIEYGTTCDYPEIWKNGVPNTVTDAINELALFDHNFSRLIRFKHDYNAETDTTFHLAKVNNKNLKNAPIIHINDDGHLERKIRVDKRYLNFISLSDEYARLLPQAGVKFEQLDTDTYWYQDDEETQWRIKFNPNIANIPLTDGYGLKPKVAMGKWDAASTKINYTFISFNDIGPFKFVDVTNGKDACELDWFYSNQLNYPTSPSVSLDSQSLIYPTAPYSTIDPLTGKYKDIDAGSMDGEKYLDNNDGLNGGRFILGYDEVSDQHSSLLNSKENHFSYLTFRNRLLVVSYFLKLLDILPKKSAGLDLNGHHVYEGLIDKRILIAHSDDDSNPHIESSDVQLNSSYITGNLLKCDIKDNVSTIVSTNYSIPNKKTTNGYSYVTDRTNNYQLIDNAVLTSKKRDDDTIDIISSNMTLQANGDGKLLSSSPYSKNNLIQIESTKFSIDDLTDGNIVRAKVNDDGTRIESTKYAIPNKKSGFDTPFNCDYEFTNDKDKVNYQLTDDALLMAKKRNDNTVDIISTNYTISVQNKGQILISEPSKTSDLIEIESSKHYIDNQLKEGNLIIAENGYQDDENSDVLKSSNYSIPNVKIGNSSNPYDDTYFYDSKNGNYKLTDSAILISKTRNDGNIDLISSKYTISAEGDNKIVVGQYVDPNDKQNSLIDITTSEFTIGDFIGHWYSPKVELRCDSWANEGKPRIVVVIDSIHNFVIRMSDVVKSIHSQFTDQYSYGDGDIVFEDSTFASLFNNELSETNQKVCDIIVLLDLSNASDRDKYAVSKDGYDAIEAICKSRLIFINDIKPVTNSDPDKCYKPYVKLNFDYSDSVRMKGKSIYTDESTSQIIYGFDTDNEFSGSKRSAEHMHSEPLISNGDGGWMLNAFTTVTSNIIWKDEYRGYNNAKVVDQEESTSTIQMNMYPVRKRGMLNDVSAMEYDPSDTQYMSGYGYCRGPLYYVYAGSKVEYLFDHIKNLSDIDDNITYPISSTTRAALFSFKKCEDIIYARCNYYVNSDQF